MSITTARIRQYEADRLAAGVTRSTVNAELAALRRAFKLALEAGKLAVAPLIKTPDPQNARTGFLEPRALDAILAELPAWARAVVESSGSRAGACAVKRSRSRVRYKRLRRVWRVACRRARHPGLILHDLRRTAVRNLERAGVSRSVAMSLTGHTTEAVYRRYAIVDSVAQQEGVAKLAKLVPAT